MKKMADLFKTGKARRQIACAVEEVENQVREVAARRERYRVDDILVANASAVVTIDPLLPALYRKATELVGIDEPRDELIKRLTEDGVEIVSIVGFGGMGKTTLARAVHGSLEAQFHCSAFVSMSQRPQMEKILKNILHQLDEERYANINETSRDQLQLINELRNFLRDKRYI
jgi:disease resistance protein RPM1